MKRRKTHGQKEMVCVEEALGYKGWRDKAWHCGHREVIESGLALSPVNTLTSKATRRRVPDFANAGQI